MTASSGCLFWRYRLRTVLDELQDARRGADSDTDSRLFEHLFLLLHLHMLGKLNGEEEMLLA